MISRHRSEAGVTARMALSLATSCLALALVFAPAHDTMAQGRDEKPTNLKVLPADISHDQLMDVMGSFSRGLGVECNYCHTRREGTTGFDMDFASDKLESKTVARGMLEMVNKINGTFLTSMKITDTPLVKVQCVTCHHGQTRPIQLEDLLKEARKKGGMAAVDSTYRDVRKKYYGGAAFDFGERSLVNLAFDVADESNPDALKILQINKEFNPESAINSYAMGKVYVELKDTANAVTSFKKAVELNPNFRRAQHELDALTGKK
jgi:hypothetical protein